MTKLTPNLRIRPLPLAAALLIGAISFAMATSVDHGFTRGWAGWVRAIWVFALIVGVLAAVALFANGMGIVTSESLAGSVSSSEPERGRVLSAKYFFAVYAGSLFLVVTIALWMHRTYHISDERAMEGVGGALFLLASSGRPWWLYYTFRRLGWFAAIESDATMRIVLGVIGAGLILLALTAG